MDFLFAIAQAVDQFLHRKYSYRALAQVRWVASLVTGIPQIG
jgi:hypothetical protein